MSRNPSNLSFSVRDEQLLIKNRGKETHRIKLWPHPNAEVRNRKNGWERFYPEFRLISYPIPKPKKKTPAAQLDLGFEVESSPKGSEPNKKQAYDQLRQTMPTSYAMTLAPFKSHQWNMIVFLSFKRRFYDLIKNNPAIAFSLANRRDFNWKVYRKKISLDDLTGMKQTDLLELLGLPGTKSLVQITKKIQPASVSVDLVDILQQSLRSESIMKTLSHLKKINTGVLTLLTQRDDTRSHVTPQLLEEVSISRAQNYYPASAHQLEESLRWHQELRHGQPVPVFRTLETLNSYHEELIAESDRMLESIGENSSGHGSPTRLKKLRKMLSAPLPKPPVPGTDVIQPLRSTRELRIEGHYQHNCVGGYIDRVKEGRCYIYRIIQPERATLSIVSSGGDWRIGELFAPCNRPAKDETRQAVKDWLNNARLGI